MSTGRLCITLWPVCSLRRKTSKTLVDFILVEFPFAMHHTSCTRAGSASTLAFTDIASYRFSRALTNPRFASLLVRFAHRLSAHDFYYHFTTSHYGVVHSQAVAQSRRRA
jgi:hypothetical protein